MLYDNVSRIKLTWGKLNMQLSPRSGAGGEAGVAPDKRWRLYPHILLGSK